MEEHKRPRVNKEKLAEQLTRLADFEVEWILRTVQEEWDRRNFDWAKAEKVRKPKEVKPNDPGGFATLADYYARPVGPYTEPEINYEDSKIKEIE